METEQAEQEVLSVLARSDAQVFVIAFCALLFGLAISNPLEFCPEDSNAPVTLTLRIDPNTADEFELAMLPRVGPAMARRIVADRESNGKFERATDLLRVSGIGPKTMYHLQAYLGVK